MTRTWLKTTYSMADVLSFYLQSIYHFSFSSSHFFFNHIQYIQCLLQINVIIVSLFFVFNFRRSSPTVLNIKYDPMSLCISIANTLHKLRFEYVLLLRNRMMSKILLIWTNIRRI